MTDDVFRGEKLTFDLPDSGFSGHLVTCNGLDAAGFREWVFCPGMLFGALGTWWGKGGDRDRPHEGLDVRCYRDARGGTHGLDGTIRVPAMYDGEIAAIRDDFLGSSIFVRHAIHDGEGRRLHTVYGHTAPGGGVRVGGGLREGEVFATLAEPLAVKTSAPAHLHLSVAWVPPSISGGALDWRTMADAQRVLLLDPLRVVSFPHAILPEVS